MFDFNGSMQNYSNKEELKTLLYDFELIIYFSKTNVAISTIKAKDLAEAKLIAYKKFSHKTIEKIELYSTNQF